MSSDIKATNREGYAEGVSLVARSQEDGARTFRLLGRTWDLFAEVFSPVHTYGTAFYSERIPFPAGGSFLEVGCGAGVTAVQAALRGCASVTALDLNERAVANTLRNATRHGVPQVRALTSDVFSAVEGGELFDAVFWNIPYVSLPESYVHGSALSRAVFDIEHRSCRAYVSGVRDLLAPGGRVFLGLGDIGDRAAMERIAGEHGWDCALLAVGAAEPDAHVEHRLFELVDVHSDL